jgi:hypothetical protein
MIVKLAQDPSGSGLLETARLGLTALSETPFGRAGRSPRAVFHGSEYGRAILAESAVDGDPFARRAAASPDDQSARDVVDGLIELACATRTPATRDATAAALRSLHGRFSAMYRPSSTCERVLDEALAAIVGATQPLPVVFAHGDPGPQNLLVSDIGQVTFLDWENAEPAGMPLWDLFAFLRGFSTWALRRSQAGSRLAAIRRNFVEGSAYTPMIGAEVERYRRALELDPDLVPPLFFACWMSLAVREAPRLAPRALANGFQFQALEMFAAHARAPVLARLLEAGPMA